MDENKENNIETPEQVNNNKIYKPNPIKTILKIAGRTLGILIIIALVAVIVRALVFKKYDVFGYKFYLIMSRKYGTNDRSWGCSSS